MKIYNSLSRQVEEFIPIQNDTVGFYMCGPTVYNYLHIGNFRTLVLGDLLRRVLGYNGHKVKYVMNITDVGHLTSDADTGEDKMEKNAKTKDDVYQVATKYTQAFLVEAKALNILPPDVMPKASDHVPEQIEIIQTLIEKGLAYESDEAVYFNVAKFPNYTQLTGQNLADMLLGARQEVVEDPKKKNMVDFVLWFKAVGRYQNHILRWNSPWGEGFPGWHIECSAMSRRYLGQPFDIHAGGIDLKFPHHTNEIAQSEAAFGISFANYWVHGEHLLIDNGKMAKSIGNFLTVSQLSEKNLNPIAYRYLILTAHYRSKLNFTWDSLTAAQNTLNHLYQLISSYPQPGHVLTAYRDAFLDAVNTDLDTPRALVVVWDLVKSEESDADKLATLLDFDRILGLSLNEVWSAAASVPTRILELLKQRNQARSNRDFALSDELRKQIESSGYLIEDTPDGSRLKKNF